MTRSTLGMFLGTATLLALGCGGVDRGAGLFGADPASPEAGAGGKAGAGPGQGGRSGTGGTPGGTGGTVVTPGGTGGTVITPGGTGGTVITPGGTGGTVITPGGTGGTVITPGGTGGTGPEPGGDPGLVTCGKTACDLAAGQRCCSPAFRDAQWGSYSPICIEPSGQCGGDWPPTVLVECDGPEDCPHGKVCCGTFEEWQGYARYRRLTCSTQCGASSGNSGSVVICGDFPEVCEGRACKQSTVLSDGYRYCEPRP